MKLKSIIALAVLFLSAAIISVDTSPSIPSSSKHAKIENITCDDLSSDLKSKLMERTWVRSDEYCATCLTCGCSCSVDDKWVSGDSSISVTYVSCSDDKYILKYRGEIFSCSDVSFHP